MRLLLKADVPDIVAIMPLQAERPGSHYDVVAADGTHLLRVIDGRGPTVAASAGSMFGASPAAAGGMFGASPAGAGSMFGASPAGAGAANDLQVSNAEGHVLGRLTPSGNPKEHKVRVTDATNAVVAWVSGKRSWARASFDIESVYGSVFQVRSFGLHALQSGFVVDDGDGKEVAHARSGAALSLPGAPSAALGGIAVTFSPDSVMDRDLIVLGIIGIDLASK
jgi:hypothetical protein